MPEQSLHLTDIVHFAWEHTDRNPSAPSHIVRPMAAALEYAFERCAEDVSGIIINAFASDGIIETEKISSLAINERLRSVLSEDTSTLEQKFGAATLLSAMALCYQPCIEHPLNIWERKREALATTARYALSKEQHDVQFGELFKAVIKTCVDAGSTPVYETTHAIAFDLMDVHIACTTPKTELSVDLKEDDQRTGIHFEDRTLPIAKTIITDALTSFSWLEANTIEPQHIKASSLYDGGKHIASVLDFTVCHPKIAEIRKDSSLTDTQIYRMLSSGIVSEVANSPRSRLGHHICEGVHMSYKKTLGSSIRNIRVYFTRIGTEGDTPIYALVGASRTKKRQAKLLSIFHGTRIAAHDIE